MTTKLPEFGRFAEPALLILVSLSAGPRHGYAIMQDVEGATGRPIGPGTLYAALSRLEERGLIEALAAGGTAPAVPADRPGRQVLETELEGLSAFAALGLRRLRGATG